MIQNLINNNPKMNFEQQFLNMTFRTENNFMNKKLINNNPKMNFGD